MKKRLVIGVSLVALVCLLGGIFTLAVAKESKTKNISVGRIQFPCHLEEPRPDDLGQDWDCTDEKKYVYEADVVEWYTPDTPSLEKGFYRANHLLSAYLETTLSNGRKYVRKIDKEWDLQCQNDESVHIKGVRWIEDSGTPFRELWWRLSPDKYIRIGIFDPAHHRPPTRAFVEDLCEINF